MKPESLDLVSLYDDDAYDPLLDTDFDDDLDESEGQQVPRADTTKKIKLAEQQDNRTPEERIADLFSSMAPRRRVLLGMLSYLDEPRRADALQEKVDELQRYDLSVFSGYNYSLLLEKAGAIEKVNEDGSAFDEEAEQLPDIVELDGARFYKPTDGKQVFWVITDAGRAYRDSDDPYGRLITLLQKDTRYHEIYRDVLSACEDDGGKTITDLSAIVDSNPLSKNPRRHCSYFAKALEDCGALRWEGSWRTTDVGKKGLDYILSELASENEGHEGA